MLVLHTQLLETQSYTTTNITHQNNDCKEEDSSNLTSNQQQRSILAITTSKSRFRKRKISRNLSIRNIMQIQIKQTDLYFPCVDGNGTPCFVNHQMDTMKIRLRQSEKSLGNLI